jgi:protein phosphatase PTC7
VQGIHGSSTCILALLHHSTLRIANLGDCSLLVIRNGEIIYRTKELQHGFNFPYQVGTHQRDEPMKDADRVEVEVEENDVVVVGSDGLMDNLVSNCSPSVAAPS